MNQVKLKAVKQEMARVNIDILAIGELKWTGMGEFNSIEHCIYYCGQESLRRNGAALVVNESSKYSGGGGGLVAKSYPTLVTPWKVAHQDSLST